MKKIIVMLLVLAVFVCGVFAEEENTRVGMNSGTDVTVSSNNASMLMKYTPYNNKTAYYVIGFDIEGTNVTLPENEKDHLKFNSTSFQGNNELDMESKIASQSIYGTGAFSIFYEIVTDQTLSLSLKFDENFKGSNNELVSFSVYEGNEANDSKIVESKTDIAIGDTKTTNWLRGIKRFFIKTADVSANAKQSYTANVTLRLSTTN